jgi:hypothetical protein
MFANSAELFLLTFVLQMRLIFYFKYAETNKFCNFVSLINRDVAQLVARYVRDVEVAGSSLVIPTEQ